MSVSLLDVALATDLDTASVSRCLRYDERHSLETVTRVVLTAQRMGYVQDRDPVRFVHYRSHGWRLPKRATFVGRPSRWGNPFKVGGWHPDYLDVVDVPNIKDVGALVEENEEAVRLYDRLVVPSLDLELLRGRDLSCWCKMDKACHADLLLALANQ